MDDLTCPWCGTRAEEHEAGDCFDAWVASKLGWTDIAEGHRTIRLVGYFRWFGKPPEDWVPWDGSEKGSWWFSDDGLTFIPPYSTHVAATWLVQEQFAFFDISKAGDRLQVWRCQLATEDNVFTAFADDGLVALCRAAVLALSEREEEGQGD